MQELLMYVLESDNSENLSWREETNNSENLWIED